MRSSTLAFLLLASLILPPADASALDSREHALFMRASPSFAEADRELNALWKRLRAGLDRDVYQSLLSEQRAWLRGGWDRDAARLFSRMNRAAAYAQAARDRIADLRARYGEGDSMFRSAPRREMIAETPPLGVGRSAFFNEQEHRMLMRSSPDYADADRRMNALWRRLRAALPPDEFQRLLADQREWLKYRRNVVAGEYMERMSRADAYAAATGDRVKELLGRYPLSGTGKSSEPPRRAPEQPPAQSEGGWNGAGEDDDEMAEMLRDVMM